MKTIVLELVQCCFLTDFQKRADMTALFLNVAAGEKMVRWNETLRDVPKGISIGCDGKPEVLRLTQDFDRILHHGAPCNVHKIEVCMGQCLGV